MSEALRVPMFSGGSAEEAQAMAAPESTETAGKQDVGNALQPPANLDSSAVGASSLALARPTSAKEKVALFAADARLGAQVMRVRAGLDAKVQMVKEQQTVSNLLSRIGLGNVAATPAVVDDEGDPDLCDPPGLRAQIEHFHETRVHLEDLLPALEDYQRHRRGLADAEQRIGIALQEAGQRSCLPNSPSGQALSACGLAHRSAAVRRLEAADAEDQQVLAKLRMHAEQALADCKRAVREYEAARKELKTVKDARARNTTAKQAWVADVTDSFVSPTIGGAWIKAAAEQTEHTVKQRLASATEAVSAKLAMLKVKHSQDYAAAVTSHLKTAGDEERDVAGHLGKLDKDIHTILEASAQAHLQS